MDRFLRACRCLPVDRTPVWFMRQAGRYQPEYRKVREKYSLTDICRQPDLCVEVTTLPVTQLGVDAAILFSDIMVPIQAVGIPVVLKENIGPVLESPLRTQADVDRLRRLEPEADVPYVIESVRLLRQSLSVPLIGFAGGPFTLASYLIEGQPTRKFIETKRMMYNAPELWHQLLQRLSEIVIAFLKAQIKAGAQAGQLFDSWVGCLSPADYQTYVFPHSRSIFQALEGQGVPTIHFGVGTAPLLPHMQAAGGDVIGIDWVTPLGQAWQRLGYQTGVQGNLDPALLLGPADLLAKRTVAVLEQAAGRPGHIFNLGHGVFPETSVDSLKQVVELVHAYEGGAAHHGG